MVQVVGPVVFVGAVLVSLAVGPSALAVVVIAAAALALLDVAVLLGRSGTRPILPVAAIPGVGLPVLVALDQTGGASAGGWERVSAVFAVAVVAAFTLVLVFGRRRGIVDAVGATFVAGLFVGLGATSLLLLHALPGGLEWVLVLGVIALAADASGAVAVRVLAKRDAEPGPTALTVVPLGAVALAAVACLLLVGDPIEPPMAALLAVAVAVAALGGEHLRRALGVEAGVEEPPSGLGDGAVLGAIDALLLAAPVAYVLARAAVL